MEQNAARFPRWEIQSLLPRAEPTLGSHQVLWTGEPNWHSLPGLSQVLCPALISWERGDLYFSTPFLSPIEALVLHSLPTLRQLRNWASLDLSKRNGEGTLDGRDINERGYGVALERQARVAERLVYREGGTCSLSDSDGDAFPREWGGGR